MLPTDAQRVLNHQGGYTTATNNNTLGYPPPRIDRKLAFGQLRQAVSSRLCDLLGELSYQFDHIGLATLPPSLHSIGPFGPLPPTYSIPLWLRVHPPQAPSSPCPYRPIGYSCDSCRIRSPFCSLGHRSKITRTTECIHYCPSI